MDTNKKVVLVGTGFVGMSMAYAMLNQGGVDELVLIDVLKDKAKGEEMDLSHGLPYAPQKMTIKAGDYSECKDANVVVITAGLPQKPGQSRLELAVANTKIVKEITEQVMASGFNGVFIIASNPVDLMSYVVSKVSGLPTSKVIGSGTVLDTARLRYLIAEYLDVTESFLLDTIAVYREKYGVCKRFQNYVVYFEPTLAILDVKKWLILWKTIIIQWKI